MNRNLFFMLCLAILAVLPLSCTTEPVKESPSTTSDLGLVSDMPPTADLAIDAPDLAFPQDMNMPDLAPSEEMSLPSEDMRLPSLDMHSQALDMSPALDASVDKDMASFPRTVLPIGPSDTKVIGPGLAIDTYSVVEPLGGTRYRIILESIREAAPLKADLFQTTLDVSTLEATALEPVTLPSTGLLVTSPSLVALSGTTYLYFVESQGFYEAANLYRTPWQNGKWGAREPVGPVPKIEFTLSWPKYLVTPQGEVTVAFRDGSGKPRIAFSQDGISFSASLLLDPDQGGGAIPTAGFFQQGSLVYTYQRPLGAKPMVSYYRISKDKGQTWTPLAQVTSNSPNVHDTTIVPRLDGGVDLYYIYPAGPQGFVLFRRQLQEDGTLGQEERVTQDAVGEPSKPHATRLLDGRLLMSWSEISKRSPQGFPAEQRLVLTLIAGDAP